MELKLVDVSKFYQTGKKSVKGVENISLTFTTDSSFVVITGESGSGKTTLIKLLTGIENFDDGEIYFGDIPISTLSANKRQDIYTQNVSFVFQDYNLIEGFTAKENIMLALLKKGVEKKEASQKALDALEKLQIKDLCNKKISKLSGGEKQRVAIARALSLESKIIIFDEPTGNLDKATSEVLVNVIKETCKDKLIIYVTHEYSLVKDVATRHITLQDGHVIEDKSFKKEKDDNTKVNDSETKFTFKSLLYVTKLFSFKRLGRLIFSFFVLFGSVLASFGISTVLATSFTRVESGYNSNAYMQGNVIDVKNKKDLEIDELSSNAYYDVNSLLFNSKFDIYYKDTVDTLNENSKALSDQLYNSTINNLYSLRINTTLVDNLELVFGSTSHDENSIYLVLNKSSIDSVFNLWARDKYEKAVGREVVLVSTSVTSYNYDIKSNNEIISKEDVEYYSPLELSATYILKNLKEAKTFKLGGIYVFEDNYSNYLDEYIYAPSFEILKDLGSQLSSKFKVENLDITTKGQAYVCLPTTNQYQLDIYTDDGKYLVKQNKEYSSYYETEINGDAIKKLNINELNTIYLSNYWENIDLDIKIDKTTYKKSQLNNIRYISNDLIDNKYYFYTTGNPAATILENSKQSGKLYYRSENDAFSAVNQLKDKAEISKFDAVILYSVVRVDIQKLDAFSAVTLAASFLFMIAFLFGMLALFRVVINKLYFRKAADQFVLNYIGYKRKDIFLTNLIQFESLAIISNIIVYLVFFLTSLGNSFRLIFVAVPHLFIMTIIFNMLFIIYLSIPFRHIGGGRVND